MEKEDNTDVGLMLLVIGLTSLFTWPLEIMLGTCLASQYIKNKAIL